MSQYATGKSRVDIEMSVLEAEPEGAAQTVVLEVDDSAPQIIGPTDDEGRPDTSLSLSCVVPSSEGTPSETEAALNEAEPEDEEKPDEESGTEERTVSKRKYPYAAMFFIMMAVVGQSYSVGGVIAILEFYFTHFLYVCLGKIAVSLGTASVNLFIALNQLSGLSGGFQADKIFGNFMTQNISNVMSMVGAFLLVFSTWQYTITAPTCCHDSINASITHEFNKNCTEFATSIVLEDISFHIPPILNMGLAIIGLTILAVGTGQLWIQSVFVGDQFDEEEQAKEQQRAFAWYYFYATIGVLGGELGMPVLRQTTGFVISLLTVAGVIVISMAMFLSGGCLYIKKPPERIRCIPRCCQKLKPNKLCAEDIELDTLLDAESTADESDTDVEKCPNDSVAEIAPEKISDSADLHMQLLDESSSPSTSTTGNSDNQTADVDVVDKSSTTMRKLKQLVPILKVFIPLIMFWAVFYQRSSTWIVQATQMDCYLGSLHVPPDVMPSIEDVMVLFVVPFLEYILYPHLRKSMGIEVRSIHKLVCGMIAITLSFFLAGLLQIYITEPSEECRGDVSIAWQLPQLLLLSFADVLVFVTGLEFAYTQSPPDLRNIVTSLYFIIQALGTVLNAGIALIPMSLLTAFFVYVGLMTLATIFFIILNRKAKFSCYEEPEVTSDG